MGIWVDEDDEEGGKREREREQQVNWLPGRKDRWMQSHLLHKCKQLVGSLTGQNQYQTKNGAKQRAAGPWNSRKKGHQVLGEAYILTTPALVLFMNLPS